MEFILHSNLSDLVTTTAPSVNKLLQPLWAPDRTTAQPNYPITSKDYRNKFERRFGFRSKYHWSFNEDPIDQTHKSHNAPASYPTMHHSEQKCAHFCSKWCIVGYGTGAMWDLWIRSTVLTISQHWLKLFIYQSSSLGSDSQFHTIYCIHLSRK